MRDKTPNIEGIGTTVSDKNGSLNLRAFLASSPVIPPTCSGGVEGMSLSLSPPPPSPSWGGPWPQKVCLPILATVEEVEGDCAVAPAGACAGPYFNYFLLREEEEEEGPAEVEGWEEPAFWAA